MEDQLAQLGGILVAGVHKVGEVSHWDPLLLPQSLWKVPETCRRDYLSPPRLNKLVRVTRRLNSIYHFMISCCYTEYEPNCRPLLRQRAISLSPLRAPRYERQGMRLFRFSANLFLGIFENNALSNATFYPYAWWRSLDDIFMILTEGLDHLKIFVDCLDDIHPTILKVY